MFGINLGGLFTGPVDAVEKVTDEKLKRDIEKKALSFGYCQYITFMYSMGNELSRNKVIGKLGRTMMKMAASAYLLMLESQTEKVIELAVPTEMVENKALLDSIHYDRIQNPKGV